MKTATVNFKTEEAIKRQAQQIAKIIGIPMGVLLDAYLRQFVATQEVYFSHVEVKKARSPENIMANLDSKDKEKLRNLLNKAHLKDAVLDGR